MRSLPSALWSLLALAWALLIWTLLVAVEAPGAFDVGGWMPAPLRPWQDKLGHAALFLVQAALVQRAAAVRLRPRRSLLLALAFCVTLGAITELCQRRLPGRDADAADFLADVAGAASYAMALALSRGDARRGPSEKGGWAVAHPAPRGAGGRGVRGEK